MISVDTKTKPSLTACTTPRSSLWPPSKNGGTDRYPETGLTVRVNFDPLTHKIKPTRPAEEVYTHHATDFHGDRSYTIR
jgi:hypothetical protein